MTWTILHNCLQMIYFRVLGTLVFHLFFKKIIVTLVPFIFKENAILARKFKNCFLSIYLDFIAGKTNVCQIECYSIVNCNFFSVQQLDKLPEDMMTVYYARITLISDLENEAENANRSRVQVIICQHNGSNTNETV